MLRGGVQKPVESSPSGVTIQSAAPALGAPRKKVIKFDQLDDGIEVRA